MKKSLKNLLNKQGYSNLRRRVKIALIILIFALIIFSGYFLFFIEGGCMDSNCFINSMTSCKKVSWIREDAQAAWRYSIKGDAAGDACDVQVTLLEVKEGTIEGSKLNGKSMVCTVQKTDTQFPEKEISQCSGLLKESMQDLIIQRMHNYLLKNVGEIRQEFTAI